MEKAFAKVMGNYEYINYGWQAESARFLSGAPTFIYYSKDYNAANIWPMIDNALSRGFNVGCDTNGFTSFGLAASHAYHVIGTYQIKDTNGNVVARLINVRNPWNIDTYSGPWGDGQPQWTAAYQAQVPYVNNKNDGSFFIEDKDFLAGFPYFDINH
jgi:Calpain family cysteine protease